MDPYPPIPPVSSRDHPLPQTTPSSLSLSLSAGTLIDPPQNNLLKTLIEKTTPPSDSDKPSQPAYKYIANSTIIQHPGAPSESQIAGRRGMHSAVGAFWNTEKDGTFSYKWDGAEKKGMDVVVSVNWIAI